MTRTRRMAALAAIAGTSAAAACGIGLGIGGAFSNLIDRLARGGMAAYGGLRLLVDRTRAQTAGRGANRVASALLVLGAAALCLALWAG